MESTAKKNYTLPIIMMVALFFMISFVTGLQNPFGIIVKNQFAASNFMSQLGNAANFIAYAFMGIPAGMLLQKIGYKKTALLAIIVGFCGVGISYLSGVAGSYAVYLTGAFVSGFSMCMLNAVVNPMLNTLGGGGKKGNHLIQFGGSLNFISAWIIYYDGEISYVQNKIIFVDDFPEFDTSKINEYVNKREIFNEDGFKISEWIVKTKDVIDFYHSIIGLI